jgi:hypothetical protein
LFASIYACSVQSTPKDVITYAWKVLDTASANQHDAVFLKVVALARDVCIDLFLICEPDTRYFTHRGIRLLRSRRVNTYTDSASLRTSIQRARF